MKITLRKRIYLLMISLVLVSFVLIGAVTLIFFRNENAKYHAERLLRKERSVLKAINYFLENNRDGEVYPFYTKEFADKIVEVSVINSFEINVFDPRGELITSTEMEYFEEGILAERIEANTLKRLAKSDSTILVSDKKEEQNYLSTYSYIRNDRGEPIAIVNLPYFSKEALNKEEVGEYFTSLIEIYVVLLIIALLIAYFLSSNITKSLRAIGERMRSADISTEYEAITWQANDEIGELVEQYNKMMKQLQISASKLAKSERESAWREMAKQVAHEIKNPLTPMKLSVQQLERATKDQKPDLDQRIERFCKLMVQQIDTLSDIASEFSNFAQMPKAVNELIDLHMVLDSQRELFKSEEVEIKIESADQSACVIYADKSQIERMMTNLIKNAVQAIPDDREGKIELKLNESGDEVMLSISDNGSGISPELVDQIFIPNFTTKSHGMGLGLSMVKTIVEFSGGKINFETKYGEGTTFFIVFPKAEKIEQDEKLTTG